MPSSPNTFLPPQPFRNALLRRGRVAWFGVRGLLFLAGLPLNLGLVLHVGLSPIIVGLAVLVVLLDLRAAHEDILLANLGVSKPAITIVAAVYPLAFEILAQVITVLARALLS